MAVLNGAMGRNVAEGFQRVSNRPQFSHTVAATGSGEHLSHAGASPRMSASEARAHSGGGDPIWVTPAFAAIAATACFFALVGLNANGFSADELFTLFLIDHNGGLAEVFRRGLTDTHPPAYYFVLFGWSRIFGLSEPALRSLSALFSIAAVGIFALGSGRAFSPGARAFAAAVGATSYVWFFESQNVRNYGLCLLASAVLLVLAIRMRASAREGRPVPLALILGLALTGLIAAFVHFYAFLTTGAVFLYLVLTIPQTRLRLAVVAAGLVILGLDLAYIRLLLSQTQQDIHHMWFRGDLGFLLGVIASAYRQTLGVFASLAALILAGVAVRRRLDRTPRRAATAEEGGWTAGLCLVVVLGVIGAGVAITVLLAPSISDQNVLVASPFLWGLMARLYDLGGPRGRSRGALVLAAGLTILIGAELSLLHARVLPRIEPWREAAGYVRGLPGCAGQAIPVVQPPRFGPPTPFFRMIAERYFFGWYLRGSRVRARAFQPGAFTGSAPDPELAALLRQRMATPGACPALAWAAHDVDAGQAGAIGRSLSRLAAQTGGAVRVQTFYSTPRRGLGFPRQATAWVYLSGAQAENGPGVRAMTKSTIAQTNDNGTEHP